MPLLEVAPVGPSQTVPPLGVVTGVQLGPVVSGVVVVAAELLVVVVAAELVVVELVVVELVVLEELVLELVEVEPVVPVEPLPEEAWHCSSALTRSVLKPCLSWLASFLSMLEGRFSKSIVAVSIAWSVTGQSPAETPA